MFGAAWLSIWPIRRVCEAVELRRLRKRLQNPHRWMVRSTEGMRPETDAEYIARLRRLAHDWPSPQGRRGVADIQDGDRQRAEQRGYQQNDTKPE